LTGHQRDGVEVRDVVDLLGDTLIEAIELNGVVAQRLAVDAAEELGVIERIVGEERFVVAELAVFEFGEAAAVEAGVKADFELLLADAQAFAGVVVVDDAGGEIVAAGFDLSDPAVDVEVGAGEIIG
jgi:hypothetical protein